MKRRSRDDAVKILREAERHIVGDMFNGRQVKWGVEIPEDKKPQSKAIKK